jgi:hypothetical protein
VKIDLGDAVLETRLIIKGHRLRLLWHIGAAVESTAKGQPGPNNWYPTIGKVDLSMDLMADKQVGVSLEFTDEMGNPTGQEPSDVSATYTVDRTDLINLTDNGDGTCVCAAVGPLGTANVHVDVTANGQSMTGDMQINVVAGMTERVNMVAGAPEETTPDQF